MRFVNFGSLNIDYTFGVDKIVCAGQTISSVSEQRFPGGKGLNQSLAAARAGCELYHAGLIGDDGGFLKELLQEADVDCRFLKEVSGGTGKAFIQVEASGQNCIVLSGGANQKNTEAYCDEVLNYFGRGDYLLLQNEVNCLSYLIDKAYEKGMKIVLNPSPMDEKILACDLSKISVFIMNEDEGSRISGETTPEKILDKMETLYPEVEVVLTLGEKGCAYSYKKQRIYQKSYPVSAVDTTGAGDCFNGVLAVALSAGMPLEKAVLRANLAASISVTRRGALTSMPTLEDLESLWQMFSRDDMSYVAEG